MRNPLRTGAGISESAPLADVLDALNVTLANVKSHRVIRLESAARTAADERAEASRLYRVARDEAHRVKPDRTSETPDEHKAGLALEAADKAVHAAKQALREAREADVPAFREAINVHLGELVDPLVAAADTIDGVREILGAVDNFTMRNGVPIEPFAARIDGTALLRQFIRRLPGGESKAERAHKALAEMARAIGGG
jgi:hypothetical protein